MPWIGSVQPHLCDLVKAYTTEFKYGDVWECPECRKQWVAKYFKSLYGHPTGDYSLTLEELDKDKYLTRTVHSTHKCHPSLMKMGESAICSCGREWLLVTNDSGAVRWDGIWYRLPKKVHSIHKCHPSLMKIEDVISTCSCGREWLLTEWDSGSGEWNGTCIYDKEN